MLRTLLLISFLAASLFAQRVDITIAPAADATLYEDSTGTTANGAGDSLFVGNTLSGAKRRAVLRFDVQSAVPAGARIVFAQVTMNVAQARAVGVVRVNVHRVTRQWAEGTAAAIGNGGNGALALPGDMTWLHCAEPQLWTTPGGDFDPSPSGSYTIPLFGTFTIGTTSRLVADVQDWVDGVRLNAGWLLKTDEVSSPAAHRLDSREQPVAALQPQLTIGYVPAGNALPVGTGCTGGNGLPLQQTITGSVVQGSQVTLGLNQGVPNGISATLMSFGILANPILVDTGCTLYLEVLPWPSFGVRLLDATGARADVYQIPIASGLFGAPVALQTFAIDPGIPRGFVLSNAHLVVFR